ncbi:MAG: metal-dependent hydrolase [bacterium]|nr:metal-dependent hydrolase [bacterium]
MLYTTHLAGGLIIGSFTGEYAAALVGTFIIDADHLIPIIRTGMFFRPMDIIANTFKQENAYGQADQRGILHSLFAWAALSAALTALSFPLGLAFSYAYFMHLILDCIDGADFFPFFPWKQINIKGPIGYASKKEHVLCFLLFGIFFAIHFVG